MAGKKNIDPEKYAKRRAAVESSTSMAEAGRKLNLPSGELQKWFERRGDDPKAWLKAAFTPRGPSGKHASDPDLQLAEGQELKAQTTKVNGDGTLNHRYDKTQIARNPAQYETVPASFHVTKLTTRIDADTRVGMQYVTVKPEEVERWKLMIEAAKEACAEMRGAAGCTPEPCAIDFDEDLMAVYALGDPHIGALADQDETGDNLDLKIAERDCDMFLDHMVDIAPSAATGYLLLIGDNYHADDDKQATPGHGHKVDVDTRAHKIFRVGVRIWAGAVRRMLAKHERVVVDVRRGNHDPLTAFFLAENLRAMFCNDPRVEVLDNVREHNYFLFGKVLIATTHGHKTKPEGLAEVMVADVPELCLLATAERHWITGHVHSKAWFDFRSCSLETLRTIFPGDAWAKGAGYRSFRGSVVIVYHKLDGEVDRKAVSLERARRAARAAA